MLTLEKARKNDAQKLAEIQKASFEDESKHFNINGTVGPIVSRIITFIQSVGLLRLEKKVTYTFLKRLYKLM
ncbi:hypothetical protein [Paenibacillus polymyxa]|uniref:hypothetical protein n=1 Tax=Paenibacillus polymyxa TaxID=1406 RepID=UPI0025B6474D|nr:hypothetical protein [Paenibacillus polymyxa]MDN4088497.1 hypothetical protein [Paenibacillus polymyxa]